MAHPNEQLLRKVDKAFQAGDLETFWSLHTDDVVVHVGGRNAVSGDYKGIAEFQAAFAKFAELSGKFALETHDILASDTHGIILQRLTAERGGKNYSGNLVGIAHFREGKISEIWFIDEDAYAADEFYK